MGHQKLLVILISIVGTMGYIPHGSIGEKEPILAEALLREVVEHMRSSFNDAPPTYLELPSSETLLGYPSSERRLEFPSSERRLELMARANKELEHEQLDYDSLIDGNPSPSLRDQEYLQHSFNHAPPTYLELPSSEALIGFPSSERRLEFPSSERRLELMARANKELEHEQLDYDSLIDGNPSPSLRDQEYLQHSSLWGHQYVTGGAGEGEQRLQPSGVVPNRQMVKTDAVLPAYCNPPNPCPVGYTEDQGCISDFENTAAFSREYQLSQRCMCDGEHMFSCPPEPPADLDMRFPDHHKNLVAKKYKNDVENPYLLGERLPIAAKKGFNVHVS